MRLELLMQIPLRVRPKALISSAMTLLPGLQQQLEAHFGCPVLDIYSLCECRFIAARLPTSHQNNFDDAFEIIPHDIFVEVLDEQGRLCAPGERGEITLTAGRNPFQAMLRYRTDDFAAMQRIHGGALPVPFKAIEPTGFIRTEG